VVAHGVGIKDAVQKGLADAGVNGDPSTHMTVQGLTALNGQQGSDSLVGQLEDRLDEYVQVGVSYF
ncbi:MAG TPA: hypothetical protein VLA31_08130, partial [Burkholderiaceae bacterium]|nr:hypothetical protein [Burkholderiaceae bacterium]